MTSLNAQAVEIDLKSATSLNQISLYKDSTFIEDTGVLYKEGELFTVLEETELQHPDADQKQKFKWYKVQTPDGKTGWIFGDGLAVHVSKNYLSTTLKAYYHKKINLGNGFESATAWIASIEGRDNFHAQDYMNPLYSEYYLVITNNRGKSVIMKCSGESARGETEVVEIITKDLTGDNYDEIIIHRKTKNVGSNIDEREIEIFTMRAGTLSSVFSENLSLTYEAQVPSPALYKFIEIEKQAIRIAYVNYVNCNQYKALKGIKNDQPKKERCLEYVVSYYNWNKKNKKFENLYGDSRSVVRGISKQSTYLKSSPNNNGSSMGIVQKEEKVCIIKHYEEYQLIQGEKQIIHWFYIKNAKGEMGYIPAQYINFKNVEHSDLLNLYYKEAPISKFNWRANFNDFFITHFN